MSFFFLFKKIPFVFCVKFCFVSYLYNVLILFCFLTAICHLIVLCDVSYRDIKHCLRVQSSIKRLLSSVYYCLLLLCQRRLVKVNE